MNSFPFKTLKHIKIKKKKKKKIEYENVLFRILLCNKMLKQLSNTKILILTSDL